MKQSVSDPRIVEQLQQRISAWIDEQTKGRHKNAGTVLPFTSFQEYALYQFVFQAELEVREVRAFSRPADAPPKAPPTILDPSQVDPWAIAGEGVTDFMHYCQTVELPESLRAVPCRQCRTTGRVACPECQGQKAIYCRKCMGAGKFPCSTCHRTGQVACRHCKGTGAAYDDLTKGYAACPECRGKKADPCPDCSGGVQFCTECQGQGRFPCARCGGEGTLPCDACGGKGQNIDGIAVEIVSRPFEERLEPGDPGIPRDLLEKMLPTAGEWRETAQFDRQSSDPLDPDLPPELRKQCAVLEGKIIVPAKGRIIRRRLRVLRKVFYALTYKLDQSENTVWLAGPDLKVFFKRNPVTDVYAGLLFKMKEHVGRGDYTAARAVGDSIAGVEALAHEVAALHRKMRARLLNTYMTGAFGAAVIGAAVLMPVLSSWRKGSLHLPELYGSAVGVNIAAAAVVALALGFLCTPRTGRSIRRILTGALVTVALLAAVYGTAALAGFDPARSLDARGMRAEYQQYFPHGRPAIANRRDIEFLERLIAKYEPTGAELSSAAEDLAWLRKKLRSDEAVIRQIERVGQRIENLEKYGRPKPKRHR